MPLILGTNSIKDTGYDVANSCRFNDDDSAYLSRTQASGSTTKFTYSAWMKRGKLGDAQDFLDVYNDNNNRFGFFWNDADQIDMYNKISGSVNFQKITTANYRDPSAWYHVVIAADTTLGTAEDRIKLWVNGVRVTSFGTNTNPGSSVNFSIHSSSHEQRIGSYGTGSSYYDGLYAEVFWIDGTAYANTDFGEFDEDSPTIWKPKDVSGLTFGTNGFYLDFADSGDLGDDESGNGNDFTENNIAAVDQGTDSPTNNFCTMNPLNDVSVSGHDFSEGNTVVNVASGERASSFATIGMTNGKWYCEMKLTNASGHDFLGIAGKGNGGATDQLGWNDYQWSYYSATGKYAHDSGEISFSGGDNTWTADDIIGLAIDLDSGTKTLKWHKNGTYQSDVTLDENASATDWGAWFFACGSGTGANDSVYAMNFGNPSFTISSGNADANGYGNFEYAVPSGYFALCTKNLAEYG